MADIWAFIAQDSPTAATDFVHKITARFEPLRDQPKIGPSREQLAPGLRVHFYKNYALYYAFDETTLTIVRVLHGARDVEALLAASEETGTSDQTLE